MFYAIFLVLFFIVIWGATSLRGSLYGWSFKKNLLLAVVIFVISLIGLYIKDNVAP